jgi:hypothetical protein
MRRPLSLVLPFLLAGPALAQDFNVDVGQNLILWPLPSNGYGAGAGQTGLWTGYTPGDPATALNDTSGTLTGVTLVCDQSSSVNSFPIVMTGDDQALMEDFFWGGGPGLGQDVATFTFEGLAPGDYRVTTYAIDPAFGGDDTQVTVVGSADAPQTVVGPWPGAHGLGVTFTQHVVSTTGTIEVELQQVGANTDPRIVCNGFQLEQLVAPPPMIQVLCDPASDHFQGTYAKMDGSGFGSGLGSGLHVDVSDGPTGEFGFLLVSPDGSQSLSIFNGVLCLGSPQGRYNPTVATNQGLPQLNSIGQFDASGVLQNLVGTATSTGGSGFDVPNELPFAPAGQVIAPGDTWYFQCWFRDQIAMPGDSANFSNMIQVVFP